jgi:CDP-glucose 4,6-dehydratase
MRREFWRGKRVLLTGHTGFKGSWLTLWLRDAGAAVTGYALEPPTTPSLFDLARVGEGVESVIGDVRDYDRLHDVVTRTRPEIVLHLAAQSVVRYSYDHPLETFAVNVLGTANVLEAARHAPGVRVVVNVTSDKCYENREWAWGYRESDPMGGHDPYSSSKGCSELVTAAYRRSYCHDAGRADLMIASGRAGNVIGGGDWTPDQLIPDVVRAYLRKERVRIRNPGAVRPWQFVLEPLNGYLMLAEKLWEGGAAHADGWNFGPRDEDARPVSWIVERLAALWGEGAGWQLDQGEHPHEAHYLKLDCSRAHADLGWWPRLALPAALEWVAEWYRAYRDAGDVRALTLAQIARWERLGDATA